MLPSEVVIVSNVNLDFIDVTKYKFLLKLKQVDTIFQGQQIIETMQVCEGDVVAFLDDDDKFESNNLKTMMQKFERNHDLVLFRNNVK